jgi:hypothetical protein
MRISNILINIIKNLCGGLTAFDSKLFVLALSNAATNFSGWKNQASSEQGAIL